jgi:hypothetical protein
VVFMPNNSHPKPSQKKAAVSHSIGILATDQRIAVKKIQHNDVILKSCLYLKMRVGKRAV